MDASQVYFIGAGARNTVFGAPFAYLSRLVPSTHELSLEQTSLTGAGACHVALRFSQSIAAECGTCLLAMRRFTGPHYRLTLNPTHSGHAALLAHVAVVAPHTHRDYLLTCTEVIILPNCLTSIPAGLAFPRAARGELSRAEPLRWTVELKPKATWRAPVVAGLRIDSTVYLLHPAKRHLCRFSLQTRHRGDIGSGSGLRYCPTLFYHSSRSTRDGVEGLSRTANKYFRVLSGSTTRKKSFERAALRADTSAPMSAQELSGMAAALDASGVWHALESVQLCGIGHASSSVAGEKRGDGTEHPDTAQTIPVIDIELLYPWFEAVQKAGGAENVFVEWLYSDDEGRGEEAAHPHHERLCMCLCGRDVVLQPYEVEKLRAAPPPLPLATCIERFYVSTTAKDVSLIISAADCGAVCVDNSLDDTDDSTLAQALIHAGARLTLPHFGSTYRIGIVDVDDKTIKPLQHYYQQDQAIVSAYPIGATRQ